MRGVWKILALCGGVLLASAAQAQDSSTGLLLTASTRAELHDEFRDAVTKMPGMLAVTEVSRRQMRLVKSWDAGGAVVDEAPEGFHYALDVVVIAPATFAGIVGPDTRAIIAALKPGEAVLSTSSAKVRRIGNGGRMEFAGGVSAMVRGIVPDVSIQNRELAMVGENLPNAPQRKSLLMRYRGPEDTLEARMLALLPADAPLRLRAAEKSEFIPSWSPVLPQAKLKLALGEFAMKPTSATTFIRDRRWETAHLINADVPLLGALRCHKVMVAALRVALQDLVDEGLGHLIAPQAFRGCDNPRLIGAERGLSRHAWGAAVDLNYSSDPVIRANAVDPRLLAVMARWGFTSGHTWGRPDPGHFEYMGPSEQTSEDTREAAATPQTIVD